MEVVLRQGVGVLEDPEVVEDDPESLTAVLSYLVWQAMQRMMREGGCRSRWPGSLGSCPPFL